MKKNKLYGVVILAIVSIVFNIIAFLLPETRGGTFWSGYSFTMAALLLQLLFFYIAFGKAHNLKKTFLGLSIAQTGITYLVLQGIWGLVCLFAPVISFKFAIIVSVILLGFYAISIITASAGRDIVQEVEDNVKVKTFFIKTLLVDFEVLLARVENEEIKAGLAPLIETVKYSDPMSHEALSNVEGRISDKYNELDNAVDADDVESVTKLCKKIDVLFVERNKKCKLLK